jgi:hypothetical protein
MAPSIYICNELKNALHNFMPVIPIIVKRAFHVLRLFASSVSFIVYLHAKVLFLLKPIDRQTDRRTDKRLYRPYKLRLSASMINVCLVINASSVLTF